MPYFRFPARDSIGLKTTKGTHLAACPLPRRARENAFAAPEAYLRARGDAPGRSGPGRRPASRGRRFRNGRHGDVVQRRAEAVGGAAGSEHQGRRRAGAREAVRSIPSSRRRCRWTRWRSRWRRQRDQQAVRRRIGARTVFDVERQLVGLAGDRRQALQIQLFTSVSTSANLMPSWARPATWLRISMPCTASVTCRHRRRVAVVPTVVQLPVTRVDSKLPSWTRLRWPKRRTRWQRVRQRR